MVFLMCYMYNNTYNNKTSFFLSLEISPYESLIVVDEISCRFSKKLIEFHIQMSFFLVSLLFTLLRVLYQRMLDTRSSKWRTHHKIFLKPYFTPCRLVFNNKNEDESCLHDHEIVQRKKVQVCKMILSAHSYMIKYFTKK